MSDTPLYDCTILSTGYVPERDHLSETELIGTAVIELPALALGVVMHGTVMRGRALNASRRATALDRIGIPLALPPRST